MSPSPAPPEPRDFFAYLAERLIARIEEEPITVTFRFADGERTFQLGPKDPMFKRLAKQQAKTLRASLARLRDKGGRT